MRFGIWRVKLFGTCGKYLGVEIIFCVSVASVHSHCIV